MSRINKVLIMFTKIRDLFTLFIFFAVLGWIYEVVLTVLAYGYFENRGFLFGPWLPIYGFGGTGLYAAFGRMCAKPAKPAVILLRIAIVFVSICVFATVFELGVSYLLDAVGIGYRSLWFYDGEPFNFDGRISLIASLRFGLIGVLALYLAVPLWRRFTNTKNTLALNIISYTLISLFLIDLLARIFFGSNI